MREYRNTRYRRRAGSKRKTSFGWVKEQEGLRVQFFIASIEYRISPSSFSSGIRGETQVKLSTSCGDKIKRLAIREGGDLYLGYRLYENSKNESSA